MQRAQTWACCFGVRRCIRRIPSLAAAFHRDASSLPACQGACHELALKQPDGTERPAQRRQLPGLVTNRPR